MITAIAINEVGESHIRQYDAETPREARDLFVQGWIDGEIVWHHSEYHGPDCKVERPAFTSAFLRRGGFDDSPEPMKEENVIIYTWWCITGWHGSDEHFVTGYFVPSR